MQETLDIVAYAWSSSTQEVEQGSKEFKEILSYIMSLRPDWAIWDSSLMYTKITINKQIKLNTKNKKYSSVIQTLSLTYRRPRFNPLSWVREGITLYHSPQGPGDLCLSAGLLGPLPCTPVCPTLDHLAPFARTHLWDSSNAQRSLPTVTSLQE